MKKIETDKVVLDIKSKTEDEKYYLEILNEFVIGQEFAKEKLASKLMNFNNRIIKGNKPASVLLFIGPMGTGKNHLIKTFARIFLGNPEAFIRVNCPVFNEDMITQEKIDYHGFMTQNSKIISAKDEELNNEITEMNEKIRKLLKELKKAKDSVEIAERIAVKIMEIGEDKKNARNRYNEFIRNIPSSPGMYPSLVVFDGIDESHPGLVNIIKEIINQGTHTLSNGQITSFTNSIIILNCNLLSEDFERIYSGKGVINLVPILTTTKKQTKNEHYKKALDSTKGLISSELIKEIGKEGVIVFKPFTPQEIRRIIDFRLSQISEIHLGGIDKPFYFHFTEDLRNYIYEESQDPFNKTFGASSIERVIELRITERISRLKLDAGDHVEFDIEKKENNEKEIIVRKIVIPMVTVTE